MISKITRLTGYSYWELLDKVQTSDSCIFLLPRITVDHADKELRIPVGVISYLFIAEEYDSSPIRYLLIDRHLGKRYKFYSLEELCFFIRDKENSLC